MGKKIKRVKRENKAGNTATKVGWTGAMVKHANSCIWAGAVMQKTPKNAKNTKKADGDQPTDRPTNITSC